MCLRLLPLKFDFLGCLGRYMLFGFLEGTRKDTQIWMLLFVKVNYYR